MSHWEPSSDIGIIAAIESIGGEAAANKIGSVAGYGSFDRSGFFRWDYPGYDRLHRELNGLRSDGKVVKLPHEGATSEATYALCDSWTDGVRMQRDRCEDILARVAPDSLRARRLSLALNGLRATVDALDAQPSVERRKAADDE